ncbi:MAG TPA: dipeptide/oligopeptide/nickel ABC transporter permease/ATP-binding protein [Acidimicrobiales bacterium]|nr:dipeptide/oligopeptide/nickel ABC transporter permease/ATP-binding protein [Acidimicrobiales bacterium]
MTSIINPLAERQPVPLARPSFSRHLLRRPVALCAVAFLGVLVVVSVAAPLLAPYNPQSQDLTRVLTGPTGHNLLGTDTLGRDVLSRLIYGGRRSLLSIAEGLGVVLLLGVPLGLVAGYVGGWTDRLLSRLGELVMAIPAIILILVVLAVVPHNEDIAMLAFGLLGAPTIMRVVRGATLAVREEQYIKAARVSGLTHLRIVTRHVLPRVQGPVIVQASLFAAYALLFETGIAYLGLTGNAASATWGGMVAEASTVIEQQSWLLYPPGAIIALTILALGLLGSAVRDAAVMDEGGAALRTVPHTPRARTPATMGRCPDGDAPALLSVVDLEVTLSRHGGATPVVDGVSFAVRAGETVGLVGESGCGKSVTALAVLRLLPRGMQVSGGRVLWEGTDLLGLRGRDFDRLRGTAFGYVSQEPLASLDPTFTIGSQLAEVLRHHDDASRRAAKVRALELLRLVELPEPKHVASSRSYELSGGMAQRVAIALALAGRPRLLVADEPTTALDVTVQAEILALLRRLQAETGMSVLLITHNWGVVADICDRALVMYAGQVVESSPVELMFDEPLHPYTSGLMNSHPAQARGRPRLATIGGNPPSLGDWPQGCRFAPRCPYSAAKCRAGDIPPDSSRTGRMSRCVRVDEISLGGHGDRSALA